MRAVTQYFHIQSFFQAFWSHLVLAIWGIVNTLSILIDNDSFKWGSLVLREQGFESSNLTAEPLAPWWGLSAVVGLSPWAEHLATVQPRGPTPPMPAVGLPLLSALIFDSSSFSTLGPKSFFTCSLHDLLKNIIWLTLLKNFFCVALGRKARTCC